MNIAQIHQLFLHCSGINTDSRKIRKDSLFFALTGKNFNGNLYAKEALKKGAKFAVVDEKIVTKKKEDAYIYVKDPLATLQTLATFHRKYLGIPILAITGSNGKTTTKELLNTVLSKKYQTIANHGNFNNHIGVPLTLLSMDEQTEFGIVEMGANHHHEIEFLCKIVLPDYGYITNFGKAHLEGFGSIEGVITAKSELYDHLIKYKKLIFLNLDDEVQNKKHLYRHIFSFGMHRNAHVKVTYPVSGSYAEVKFNQTEFKSQLIGSFNSVNIAAALCIGLYFKVPFKDIETAIKNYKPNNNRSQIIEKGSNTIIMDAYNANPTSMIAAIKNFAEVTTDQKKLLILGDMFELGESTSTEHQVIINLLKNTNFSQAFLVGEHFNRTHTDSPSILKFQSFKTLKEHLKEIPIKDSYVLIKGSRGMALERLLEDI